MQEIYRYALKLLAARDYSTHTLHLKLEERFGNVPNTVIERLTAEGLLDDARFAQTFIRNRTRMGRPRLRAALHQKGIAPSVIQSAIEHENWPSTGEIVEAKMKGLKLRTPLSQRDAARLFRSVKRLGYDADEILCELEHYS
jgi:SOS response regulatory protein OraA/RecX